MYCLRPASLLGIFACIFGVACTEPDFQIAANPNAVTLSPGQYAAVDVAIAWNGPSRNVALALDGAPNGVAGVFNPTTTAGSTSRLDIGAANNAAPGTYAVTVRGTSGSRSHSAAVAVAVTAPTADFSMELSASLVSVKCGLSTSVGVSIERQGLVEPVTLSLRDVPTGVDATFAPDPEVGGGSTLSVVVGASTVPGSYALYIDATAGSIQHTNTLALLVVAVTTPDFSIALAPQSFSVEPGASGTVMLRIDRVGSVGPVSLSLEGAPAGVTSRFEPNPAEGASSILVIEVDRSVAMGSLPVTVAATAAPSGEGGTRPIAHSAVLELNVGVPLGCGGASAFLALTPLAVINVAKIRRRRTR